MARRRSNSSPGDNEIPPRRANETAWEYRVRYTLAKYGETPGERRARLGRERGLSKRAAQGHGREATQRETESQRRNRLSVQQYGETVSQRRRRLARDWLTDNGYTPEATGMTWTSLLRLEPRLRYMFDGYGEGTKVTPQMIHDARDLEFEGELEAGWAFERLWQRYESTKDYRENKRRLQGQADWAEYQTVHVYIPSLAPQWWYYH